MAPENPLHLSNTVVRKKKKKTSSFYRIPITFFISFYISQAVGLGYIHLDVLETGLMLGSPQELENHKISEGKT